MPINILLSLIIILGNEDNFSFKEVTSSGIGSVYLKLNNYATGNVTRNLVNVEGIDTLANPLI